KHHPASTGGAFARLYFASQVRTNPPTIVMIVNKPALFGGAYERYLMNQIREQLPFAEVPVDLIFRSKRRAEEAAVQTGRMRKRDRGTGRFEEVSGASTELDDAVNWDDVLKELPDDADAYFDD
ncbi:MAG: hypothetical protein AAFQ71_13740, partial [Planctomycetota bacterium]